MDEVARKSEVLNTTNAEPTEWDSLARDVPYKNDQANNGVAVDTEARQREEGLHHPKAEQLNALQESLKQAEADGDSDAIKGINNAMKMVIDRNRFEITPEQYDALSEDDRERFLTIKMQEAKILGDKDEFDFWNTSYKNQFPGRGEGLEQEKPQYEAVPFAEIAKELEDPRYEELGHGTISAENAQSILNEGLRVGGSGRDTDIQSNFMRLANTDADALRNATEDWQHNNAKFIVIYRVPFEYKMPLANQHSSETYGMFYESNNDSSDVESGKYSKDFAFAYLDVNTGLVYKNNAYKGNLDDPEQKMAMENKYQLLRNETANKIPDPEAREAFLSMAESWHEMGESMMPKQPEQIQPFPTPEDDRQVEIAAESAGVTAEGDSGRTKIASGEASSIYKIEKADGKTSSQVESDYYDAAARFRDSHPNIKNNLELSYAVTGLATDLALVDATRGRILTNGNAEQKASLMADYDKLMEILNNPEASDEDKQAISEYFSSLDGNAMRLMRENYDKKPKSREEAQENESSLDKEQDAGINQELNGMKTELEKFRTNAEEDSSAFDKILSELNELINDNSKVQDLDLLENKLNSLSRANEKLRDSTMKFLQKNIEYESGVANGSGFDSDERKYVSNNEEYIIGLARKTDEAYERIDAIRQYISNAKNLAQSF